MFANHTKQFQFGDFVEAELVEALCSDNSVNRKSGERVLVVSGSYAIRMVTFLLPSEQRVQ